MLGQRQRNVSSTSAQHRLNVSPASAQCRANVCDVGPPVKTMLGQCCIADIGPTFPQWLAEGQIAIWVIGYGHLNDTLWYVPSSPGKVTGKAPLKSKKIGENMMSALDYINT